MYKREYKRQLLIEQSMEDRGNHYKILKALYNLFLEKAKENNTEYSPELKVQEKVDAILNVCENAETQLSDISKYQKQLQYLGYVYYKKVNGEWRTYIVKDLDF